MMSWSAVGWFLPLRLRRGVSSIIRWRASQTTTEFQYHIVHIIHWTVNCLVIYTLYLSISTRGNKIEFSPSPLACIHLGRPTLERLGSSGHRLHRFLLACLLLYNMLCGQMSSAMKQRTCTDIDNIPKSLFLCSRSWSYLRRFSPTFFETCNKHSESPWPRQSTPGCLFHMWPPKRYMQPPLYCHS